MTSGSGTPAVAASALGRKRARLLVIGPTPPPHHGISTYMERLIVAPALHEAFDVRHLDNADRRDLENIGRLDMRNIVLALWHIVQLLHLLVRFRPDVVYFEVSQNRWGYLRDAWFIVLPKLVRSRVAMRLNGSDFRSFYEASGALMRWVVRFTCARVDAVAVLGERLRGIYEGLIPARRVSVVPNGAADPCAGELPARGGVGTADRTTVTFLGALYKPKGILDFLSAAAMLHGRRPDLRFVAAGGWYSEETRAEVLAHVEQLGINAVVDFPGVVVGDGKLSLLRRTDVLVFPGIQAEGQPFVILEAMAAGVPVVATAKGAIEDMVVDGETGFIVADRAPSALAEAIERIVADDVLQKRLGNAARRRYVERFTDEHALRTLIDWLRGAARGHTAAVPARDSTAHGHEALG